MGFYHVNGRGGHLDSCSGTRNVKMGFFNYNVNYEEGSGGEYLFYRKSFYLI